MGLISFNPKINFIGGLINKMLLPQMNFISCIDQATKNELIARGLANVSVEGDTRFDQVFYRLSQEPKLKLKSLNKILVCGSTWPEDETVLYETFSELIKKNIKIVLSPHEVDAKTILRIQKEIIRRGLSYQILSNEIDFLEINFENNILIIDKIGYLADAYRYGDMAFVGGSFKGKIHSVMEPLCCGLPVVTGPYYRNNPEAVKYQNRYVFQAFTSEDLVQISDKLILIPKNEILNEMQQNKNASLKVLTLIENLV